MCCRVCECICSVLHMKISGRVCIRMRAEEPLFSRNVLCVSESLCVTGFVCVCECVCFGRAISVRLALKRGVPGTRLSKRTRDVQQN